MESIYENKHLTSKYDMLQLMVCQNILNEINREVNELVAKYVNHIDELKGIYAQVWVNPLLFDVFVILRLQGLHKQFFTYNVDFNINKKMKDNEYAIFNIGIKILDNYKVKGTEESV